MASAGRRPGSSLSVVQKSGYLRVAVVLFVYLPLWPHFFHLLLSLQLRACRFLRSFVAVHRYAGREQEREGGGGATHGLGWSAALSSPSLPEQAFFSGTLRVTPAAAVTPSLLCSPVPLPGRCRPPICADAHLSLRGCVCEVAFVGGAKCHNRRRSSVRGSITGPWVLEVNTAQQLRLKLNRGSDGAADGTGACRADTGGALRTLPGHGRGAAKERVESATRLMYLMWTCLAAL